MVPVASPSCDSNMAAVGKFPNVGIGGNVMPLKLLEAVADSTADDVVESVRFAAADAAALALTLHFKLAIMFIAGMDAATNDTMTALALGALSRIFKPVWIMET